MNFYKSTCSGVLWNARGRFGSSRIMFSEPALVFGFVLTSAWRKPFPNSFLGTIEASSLEGSSIDLCAIVSLSFHSLWVVSDILRNSHRQPLRFLVAVPSRLWQSLIRLKLFQCPSHFCSAVLSRFWQNIRCRRCSLPQTWLFRSLQEFEANWTHFRRFVLQLPKILSCWYEWCKSEIISMDLNKNRIFSLTLIGRAFFDIEILTGGVWLTWMTGPLAVGSIFFTIPVCNTSSCTKWLGIWRAWVNRLKGRLR